MTNLRHNDLPEGSLPIRSEHIFNSNGLWYFNSRDGREIGPFRYESEALQCLTQFIQEVQAADRLSQLLPKKPHFRLGAIR